MLDILEVIKNIESIYTTNSSLNVLKDFERVLSELDMYAYKNWEDGELSNGPVVSRHWVTSSFMWPENKMPDPAAAKRLLDYGCKVKYKKSVLLQPREIKTPEDIRPGTKKGKLDRKPIWVVEITMPKKLCQDVYHGYMSRMEEMMDIPNQSEKADAAPATAGAEGAMSAPAQAAIAAAGAGGIPNV